MQTRLTSIKVKTAKSRSLSSTEWLKRQLNDPFVIQSKIDGYRSRAAYKILEINEKFNIVKPGMKILDLGAAPGGWSQVVSNITKGNGKVVAIDILEMPEVPYVTFAQKDFYAPETMSFFLETLEGKADLILSDMAPNTTGHSKTDHIRIIDLCERLFDFSCEILNLEGSLVMKIFQGGAETILLNKIKKCFREVKHFKPKASRKDSTEIYLIAKGFKMTNEA